MSPNRNGNDSHYGSVNRSDVPQGRKGKHRKAVADILSDLSKLSAQQAVKIPLERPEWREDAESALGFEPRHPREENPRSNFERRKIPVRLAHGRARRYGRN